MSRVRSLLPIFLNKKKLVPSRKSFSDFYENLQKWSLDRKNLPYFGKSAKNFFLLEKNPTSIFKIGGILGKKMFRKFLETSVIISLYDGHSRYFDKKFQILF